MRNLSPVILCLLLSVQPGRAEMSPERIFDAMRKNMPPEAKCTQERRYDFKCEYETTDGRYVMEYSLKAGANNFIRNISVSLNNPISPEGNDAPSLSKMMFQFFTQIGISTSQTDLCLKQARKQLEPRGIPWPDGNYVIRCLWSNSVKELTIILIENKNEKSSP